MRYIFYSAFIICLAVNLTVVHSAHGEDGYGLKPGRYPVGVVESLSLHDAKRKKDLIVRIHYPKGKGPFPVIIFSHGFGAGKDAFATIGKHWASHGYVTIHPNHADGGTLDRMRQLRNQGNNGKRIDRDELRKRLRERFRKGRGRGIRSRSGGLTDRVRDVSGVIEALAQVEKKFPAIKGKLDRKNIGVSGHSYGACVTMLVGGVTAKIDGENKSLVDRRVKCILPFSAAGTGEYGLHKTSWKSLKLPTLYVTGTRDIRPGYRFEWRKEPFELSPKGEKYLVVMDGATHFHFGGGAPGLGSFKRARVREDKYTPLVKDVSVAFWDAYLRQNKKAKAYLSSDRFGKSAGEVASIASK
ncbi:MAG: alpha/beta hydrolase family protein [Gemmataceae bacterium]